MSQSWVWGGSPTSVFAARRDAKIASVATLALLAVSAFPGNFALVYMALASLSSASLDLATYRFVTAFEPTCKEYINLGSFIVGPVLMCLVIGAIILYCTKVKRQAIYTI